MPEIEQVVTEASTETPVADVAAQDNQVEADETSTETTPEPKTYTRWQDALADADPEELLKDDRIAGRIGQVADKRAREIAAEQKRSDDLRKQQEADRTEEARLRQLRAENPVAYATEMDRKDASTDALREETRRQAALAADVTGSLTEYVRKNFTAEVIDSLANRTYEGTYAQGVTAYIADITKASKDALRAQWEKDELPALRKKILTEMNGGEATIDSSATESRPGKKYNSNLEASTALMEGKLSIQEYTRQAYRNGWR